MRHAIIDSKNFVVNVVVYNPHSTWEPPKGCYIVPSEVADVGDWYDKESNKFFKPELIT